MQRLAATWHSLHSTGQLDAFAFHILSDSTDRSVAAAERIAWMELTQSLGAQERIFYRRRTQNIDRKAGNIADWLRSNGRNYDFMIILDADSLMSGETLRSIRLAGIP